MKVNKRIFIAAFVALGGLFLWHSLRGGARLSIPEEYFGKSNQTLVTYVKIGSCNATVRGYVTEISPRRYSIFYPYEEKPERVLELVSGISGAQSSDSVNAYFKKLIISFLAADFSAVRAASGPLKYQNGGGYVFWCNNRLIAIESCYE